MENVLLAFAECSTNFGGLIPDNVRNCTDRLELKKEMNALRTEVLYLRSNSLMLAIKLAGQHDRP